MNELTIPNEQQSAIDQIVQWSEGLVVSDNDSRLVAIERLRTIKTWCKKIEEFFADSKSKAHDTWKAIVAQEKSLTGKLQDAESKAKKTILVYDAEQERIRIAEQARLQEEANRKAEEERKRLQEEANRQAEEKRKLLQEEASIFSPETIVPVVTETPVVSVAAPVVVVASKIQKSQAESTRKVWKARVIDNEKVPREYLLVNQTALDIQAKLSNGTAKVDGVEFYEEHILSIKTR